MLNVILPLACALLAAPVTLLVGLVRPRLTAAVAVGSAAVSTLAVLWGWARGGGSLELPWVPTWGLRLEFTFDGLGALYALLATGVGLLVLVYASSYLPRHLHHQGRPDSDALPFYAFVLLFMGAMVGLAFAGDLVLLFVFWDLTAVASYFLIAFDRAELSARAAALSALFVTGVSAVLLLVGAVFLGAAYGTFSVTELAERAEPGAFLTGCSLLIVVAALAKCAQAPLHFWLPRAMAAPTPVSAYLHSAAMVAAGVYLLGRVYPLLQFSPAVLDLLVVVGFVSIFMGGTLALTRDVLKQLLAYSTIAQYGFVVAMYGLGGPYGAAGAAFYVLVHALAKSALFLTAGTVTEATGETRLSRLGGLGRSLPLLAAGSALAGATLASLPLTVGFFADEFFFTAALERGPFFAGLAVFAAAPTLAYTWRFWSGLFLGARRTEAEGVPRRLVLPVAALGLAALVGGIASGPYERLAEAAGRAAWGEATPLSARYHLEIPPEYLLALATTALGVLIILTRRYWQGAALDVARLSERVGPEAAYRWSVRSLYRLSERLHGLELRNLRSRAASVLLPTALLVGAGVLAVPGFAPYQVGPSVLTEVPLALLLLVVAVSAAAAVVTRGHLTLTLVLSSTGFLLAVIYALYGAPSVALVAVLIETLLSLLLVTTLGLVPPDPTQRRTRGPAGSSGRAARRRKLAVAGAAWAFTFITAWATLSQDPAGQTVADEHLRLAPAAHARNVVTATLADFRGLDTLGEATVVALVLLGVTTLLAGGGGRPAGTGVVALTREPAARTIKRGVARVLYLPVMMVAAALLVKGFVEVGDGFSAGVVAALGVLLRYLSTGDEAQVLLVRLAVPVALAGLLLALATAALPLLWGEAVLTHVPPPGTTPVRLGTLELMSAALFDAGVFVLVLGFTVGVVAPFARLSAALPDKPREGSGLEAGREGDPEGGRA